MNRIIVERQRDGQWTEESKWSEDFDGHVEDMPHRALKLMAELEVGCGIGSALRARCVLDQENLDEGFTVVEVGQNHPGYDEAAAEERENERERAEELAADLKREDRRGW